MVGLADDLLAAHLEELFEPAVDEHVAALDVLGEDDGGRVVDDGLEQMLALAESGVRAGQLGRAFSHPLLPALDGYAASSAFFSSSSFCASRRLRCVVIRAITSPISNGLVM